MNTIIILFYLTLINVNCELIIEDDYGFLTPDDFKRGEELEKQNIFSVDDDRVPIKYNNFSFEGDIIIPESTTKENEYIGTRSGRHWSKGYVPAKIESKFSEEELAILSQAVKWFYKNTCIKWIEKQPKHTDYVAIIRGETGRFCRAVLGRNGGRQELELGNGCFSRTTVIHEMQHAIGFIHEQSRPDRDRYVQIFFDRIERGLEHNFQINNDLFSREWNIPYDPNSNMHYRERSFGIQNAITIQAKNGQQLGCEHLKQCPTKWDIRKINTVYRNECRRRG